MAKSIKLKNDTYIDSTGIMHNRSLLSTIINNLETTINNLLNRIYIIQEGDMDGFLCKEMVQLYM